MKSGLETAGIVVLEDKAIDLEHNEENVAFIGGLIAPDQGLFPKYDAGLLS